ncbi:MAG TPA: hypothetical protein VLB83_04885 [Candidatus Paceibacterota bacterium]|nr:hypothetical protein [Candidatus Paceibacterota bacterium]
MVLNRDVPQRFFVFTTKSGVRFGVEYPHNEVSSCVVHQEFDRIRNQLKKQNIPTIADRAHDALIFETAPSVRFVATSPDDAAMLLRDFS